MIPPRKIPPRRMAIIRSPACSKCGITIPVSSYPLPHAEIMALLVRGGWNDNPVLCAKCNR